MSVEMATKCSVCGCLTSVTILNSVTRMGEGAFRGCSRPTSDNTPDSVIRGWKQNRRCAICGGNFNLFSRCKSCGRKKDYQGLA